MEDVNYFASFDKLRRAIVSCKRCPRLVQFREQVLPAPAFRLEPHWRKPVPGYGDEKGWLLITGLAPAIVGGNRTGRIFTGDLTSQFLMKALYETGFANHPFSISRDDGLTLKGCYLTAAVKCVPPFHKPTNRECLNCSPYYDNELTLLKQLTHVLVLGRLAFDVFMRNASLHGEVRKGMHFKHGMKYQFKKHPILYASYHPSPRNTNTGLLSEKDFIALLNQIRRDHDDVDSNC